MRLQNVQTFYPLSPMQQGMLFHSVSMPDSEMYCQQLFFTIEGRLDVDRLEQAWQHAVRRHAILRTFFVWENLSEPIQVVQREAELMLAELDMVGLPVTERRERERAFLAADRQRGFTLGKPPLSRVTLIRIAEDRYRLVWSHHHVLLDGQSVNRIIREVFVAYEALRAGKAVPDDFAPPFKAYIAWLRRQDLAEAEAYWREALRGFDTPTPIVDRLRTGNSERGIAVSTEVARLTEATTNALKTLVRQNKLTLNTVVMGAWAILLSRYSGERDVVFGAAVSGRPAELSGADKMVGNFINTLPVRTEVSGDPELIPWLRELQSHQVRSRQYEHTPLAEIQRWSDVPKGHPLFESILAVANYQIDESSWKIEGSLRFGAFQTWESSNYPLNAYVELGSELALGIVHQVDCFTVGTVRRMLGHWATLLEGMVADPDASIRDLPMLTPAEREQILVTWNDTSTEFATEHRADEWVAVHARRAPQAIAVADEQTKLTYRELNGRANQLARHLLELGIRPGRRVAVCLERGVDLVVGLLGILRAGGAYVPLDVEHPTERLAYMLEDSGAAVLLTHERLRDAVPLGSAHVVNMDSEVGDVAAVSSRPVSSTASLEDLAYVIYTSGSTGTPKGTCITHRSLLNLLFWHQQTFDVKSSDRASQIAGPAFDAFGWEIWPYLTCGASVLIVPAAVVASPEDLRDWLVQREVTIGFLPTPLAERVLTLTWPSDVALRTLLTGGDKLHRFPAESLPFELVNNYGPTESTVVTTSGRVMESHEAQAAPSIGRPITNTQVLILDRHLAPVPIGVPGELHVGGAGLAAGYHARPELTAERFIDNPLSEVPSPRLYKTGDLARYLPDGSIEFLGRLDFQIKLRGYRIELGEIESALGHQPAVRECVVVTHTEEDGDQHLVAYVVATSEPRPSSGELRRFLKMTLPEYMVPAVFVWLDALPLSPNGKVDRRALPAPEKGRPELGSRYVPPSTEVEQAIAAVWQDVLGIDQVGLDDNFFDLGGHSLLMTRVYGKLRNLFDRKLTMLDLFRCPTVSSLASYVGRTREETEMHTMAERAALRRAAISRRKQAPRISLAAHQAEEQEP